MDMRIVIRTLLNEEDPWKSNLYTTILIKAKDLPAIEKALESGVDIGLEDLRDLNGITPKMMVHGAYLDDAPVDECLQISVDQDAYDITVKLINGDIELPSLEDLGEYSRSVFAVLYNNKEVKYYRMPMHVFLALHDKNITEDMVRTLNCASNTFIHTRLPRLEELEYENGYHYKDYTHMKLCTTPHGKEEINAKLAGSQYEL